MNENHDLRGELQDTREELERAETLIPERDAWMRECAALRAQLTELSASEAAMRQTLVEIKEGSMWAKDVTATEALARRDALMRTAPNAIKSDEDV